MTTSPGAAMTENVWPWRLMNQSPAAFDPAEAAVPVDAVQRVVLAPSPQQPERGAVDPGIGIARVELEEMRDQSPAIGGGELPLVEFAEGQDQRPTDRDLGLQSQPAEEPIGVGVQQAEPVDEVAADAEGRGDATSSGQTRRERFNRSSATAALAWRFARWSFASSGIERTDPEGRRRGRGRNPVAGRHAHRRRAEAGAGQREPALELFGGRVRQDDLRLVFGADVPQRPTSAGHRRPPPPGRARGRRPSPGTPGSHPRGTVADGAVERAASSSGSGLLLRPDRAGMAPTLAVDRRGRPSGS